METIRLHEIYLSIQGESTLAGRPCVMVRATGCPLRCVWCDTRYAFEGGEVQPVDEVVARACGFGVPLVEVTGGEPLAQPSALTLLRALADRGKTVLLETSGALDVGVVDPRVHIIMDVKCPGSGMADRADRENFSRLKAGDEVKFVVQDRADYDFAREVIRENRLAERFEVLVSPVFGAVEPRTVAEWILADRLPARLQLPLHKFIWSPEARGV